MTTLVPDLKIVQAEMLSQQRRALQPACDGIVVAISELIRREPFKGSWELPLPASVSSADDLLASMVVEAYASSPQYQARIAKVPGMAGIVIPRMPALLFGTPDRYKLVVEAVQG